MIKICLTRHEKNSLPVVWSKKKKNKKNLGATRVPQITRVSQIQQSSIAKTPSLCSRVTTTELHVGRNTNSTKNQTNMKEQVVESTTRPKTKAKAKSKSSWRRNKQREPHEIPRSEIPSSLPLKASYKKYIYSENSFLFIKKTKKRKSDKSKVWQRWNVAIKRAQNANFTPIEIRSCTQKPSQ